MIFFCFQSHNSPLIFINKQPPGLTSAALLSLQNRNENVMKRLESTFIMCALTDLAVFNIYIYILNGFN